MTNDAIKQLFQKIARRLVGAAAAISGASPAWLESWQAQVAAVAVALLLGWLYEFLATKHNVTIVKRAVELTLEQPYLAEKMLEESPKALTKLPK